MDFKNYETIKFSYEGRVLTVSFDHGPMNAVDTQLHEEMARLFYDLQKDPDSDIIILTGEGKAFSAGGNANWMVEMYENPAAFRAVGVEAKQIVFGLLELEKPIICRMNGAAAGLGATIALLCDIVIADENAAIGDPHVRMGFVAGDGGAVIWPQLIGFAKAKELLMTGDMLTAPEAKELGLVNYCVPTEELDAKVAELVKKIARNPRLAVRWTKTVTNIPLRELAHKLMDASIAYESMSNLTADHKEAVQAFIGKRKPTFSGE